MVVTIDGPAGAGKSTVARAVAERLGYRHVDTGEMYRELTAGALERGAGPDDRRAPRSRAGLTWTTAPRSLRSSACPRRAPSTCDPNGSRRTRARAPGTTPRPTTCAS